MLIVDNKVIETPIKDIINLLVQELAIRYIDKLDKVEYKQDNIRVTCPIHANGHERTPSCDILMYDKGSVSAGTVKCFGCGYKTHLVKFIADCLNKPYRYAKEWLLNVSEYSYLEDTRDIEDLDIIDKSDDVEMFPEVTLDELRRYDFIHPYMFKRKLTDDIIEKFEVGYDPDTNSLTFPVYVDGMCKFVAKRNVSTKFFYLPTMKVKPIYGLDYVTDKEVIITESVINALTCWTYGKQAIALFGTGSKDNYKVLNELNIRHYILMFDGDEAGRRGAENLKRNVQNSLITDVILPEGKDVNDLSREEFYELLDKYAYDFS